MIAADDSAQSSGLGYFKRWKISETSDSQEDAEDISVTNAGDGQVQEFRTVTQTVQGDNSHSQAVEQNTEQPHDIVGQETRQMNISDDYLQRIRQEVINAIDEKLDIPDLAKKIAENISLRVSVILKICLKI